MSIMLQTQDPSPAADSDSTRGTCQSLVRNPGAGDAFTAVAFSRRCPDPAVTVIWYECGTRCHYGPVDVCAAHARTAPGNFCRPCAETGTWSRVTVELLP